MAAVLEMPPGDEPNESGQLVDVTVEVLTGLNDAYMEFVEMWGLSDAFADYLEQRNATCRN